MSFSFRAHRRTHFWCTVRNHGKEQKFPIFGEGAPRGSNNYDLHGRGIYENGQMKYHWAN